MHVTLAKHYPPHVLGWVKRATWHAHPGVPLSRIDMSRRPGARDPKKVEGIAQAVKDGKPMPPVVLVNTGDAKLQIADGYHRTLGFEHAGKAKIPALIASGVGAHGPWEKRMHAAKLNLTAEHAHVLDLAGVCTGPGPCDTTPFGSGSNWVTKVGGLPLYIRAVAKAFRRQGHPESEAISRAVGVVRNWAEGKGNVTPATRARASAAIAEWERKKTQAHSLTAAPTTPVDLATTIMSTNDLPTVTVSTASAAPKTTKRLLPDEAAVRKAIAGLSRLPAPLRAAAAARIKTRARELGMTVNLTADRAATVDLTFTEQLHPRGSKGTAQGGKFVAKNGGGKSGGTAAMAAQTRDFQRRTGVKQSGRYDTATQRRIDALLNPKAGGGGGGKGKKGKKGAKGGKGKGAKLTAKQTAARNRTNAARTAVAVNKLSPAQRELFRAKRPTPPTGYRWNAAGLLVAVATNPQARRVRALLARP